MRGITWIFSFLFPLLAICTYAQNILSCTPPNKCQNSGKCVTQSGQNFCLCASGFVGSFCQFVDPCTQSQCQNGGTCSTVVSTDDSQRPFFNCSCPLGFQASLCEISITNACDNNPCKNHGTCQLLTLDHFNCICPNGFKGETCEVIDHCSLNPCSNGGTCVEVTDDNFSCTCPEGFTGAKCVEDVDECAGAVNPCVHGRCINVHGSYRCECDKEYSGKNCDQLYHPCNPSPCNNNGQCDLINPSSYRCRCFPGFSGSNCEVNLDDCENHKCLNGGSCVDGIRNYTCKCPPTFTGPFCGEDVDECAAQPNICQNGGTCSNTKGGFLCVCVNGWEGQFCQDNHNDCDGTKCYNGGTCEDRVASFHCECPLGYTGLLCHLRDACMSSPCHGGAICDTSPVDGGYMCTCPKGLKGVDCSEDVDECIEGGNPCEHGGTCVNTVGSYECRCSKGWKGSFCDEPINECLSSPCQHGATCLDDIGQFICVCMPGFTGIYCESNIDDCLNNPCLNNGVCRDLVNNYTCACQRGFVGLHCEKNVDDCTRKPCLNGGSCKDLVNGFTCDCPKGYAGKFCERNVNDCAQKPCFNGWCKDLTDGFVCSCDRGWNGTLCEQPIDDCLKNNCLNGATCHDLIDNYACDCPKGFMGKNCEHKKEVLTFVSTFLNTVQPTTIDIHKFDGIDRTDRDNCVAQKCSSKQNNGICDPECNFPACGFDGMDCSAGLDPFKLCKFKEYCVHVFKDGKCDAVCNVEPCLFDGFDCLDKTDLTCNPLYSNYCLSHMGDGQCDSGCNTRGCNYDGGDCNGDKEKRTILVGAVALVLTVPPDVFAQDSKKFLMSLGNILDVNLQIKLDDQNRPMVYRWNSRDGVESRDPIPINFAPNARIKRQSGSDILRGVFIVLVIDVTKCTLDGRQDCFSKIESVANFMATPKVSDALKQTLGPNWDIYSATPEETTASTATDKGVLIGSIIGAFSLLLLVVLVVTKKRKIIAMVWNPPGSSADRNSSFSRNSNCRISLEKNFGGAVPNVYESDVKRFRRDDPEPPDCFERNRSGKFYNLPYQLNRKLDCDQYSESETYSTYTDNSEATAIPMSKSMRLASTEASGKYFTNHTLKDLVAYEDRLSVAAGSFNGLAVPSGISKASDGQTPIMVAVRNYKDAEQTIKVLQDYIKSGANLNDQTENDGETALIIAIRFCRLQVVKTMLQLGADPTVVDHKGNNALHHAVNVNNVELVSIIFSDSKHPIDLEAKNDDGCTGLILAAKAAPGSACILDLLMNKKASVSAQDNDGRTALHWASCQNDVEAMECLLRHGANKDSTNQYDQTPLYFAVREGHREATICLLKHGASKDLADNMDVTPLRVAEDSELKYIAELLTDTRFNAGYDSYQYMSNAGTLPHPATGNRQKPKPPKRTKSLRETKAEANRNNNKSTTVTANSRQNIKRPSLSESTPSPIASSSSPSSGGIPSVGLSSLGGSPPLSVESAGYCRSANNNSNNEISNMNNSSNNVKSCYLASQKDVLSPSCAAFSNDSSYVYPAYPATSIFGGGGAVYNQSPPAATDYLGSPNSVSSMIIGSPTTDMHRNTAAYSRIPQHVTSSPNYPTSANGYPPTDIGYFHQQSPPDFGLTAADVSTTNQKYFAPGMTVLAHHYNNNNNGLQQQTTLHQPTAQQQANCQKSSNNGYTHITTGANGVYDYVDYSDKGGHQQLYMSAAKNV